MRKATFLLILACVFSLTSCVMTESVAFNADKSGKINYRFDMSKMMSMLGKEMGSMGAGLTDGKSKDVDTTFTMTSLYELKKDSIAKLSKEELAKIKKMEKFTCHMVMNEKDGVYVFDMYAGFKNTAELQQMVSPVNVISGINPMGKNAVPGGMPKNEGVTNYVFDGRKFSKKVSVMEKGQFQLEFKKEAKKMGANEEDVEELSNAMSQSMEMISQDSDYIMVVEFPKKVKKVSAPNAKISDNKKMVTLTCSMKEYMEGKGLDFEVELE